MLYNCVIYSFHTNYLLGRYLVWALIVSLVLTSSGDYKAFFSFSLIFLFFFFGYFVKRSYVIKYKVMKPNEAVKIRNKILLVTFII